MPFFKVTALDRKGGRKTLVLDEATEREAVASARSRGLAVLSVKAASSPRQGTRRDGDLPPWHPSWLLPMTSFDAELGFYQLASMLKSGVSILQALETVAEQSRRPRAARAWRTIHDRLSSGAGLSEAMAAHRRVFGAIGIELVRVGEHSGELDVALARAAEEMEGRRNLRMMVANALVYPLLATVMALAVSTYLVVAVIPKITEFLESGGVSLPPMTQFLMDLSHWIRANGLFVLLGIAGFLLLFSLGRLFRTGRELEDLVLLRLPVSGRILRLSGTALFSRAMKMLVDSGVTLLDALDVTRQLMGNRRLMRRVEEARESVMRGASLADSLLSAPEFMPMLPRMTAVGETTGALGEAFAEVARFHERMLAVTIKRFSVTIEPVMIVVTALIVGFVYLSFFMALFSMAGVD